MAESIEFLYIQSQEKLHPWRLALLYTARMEMKDWIKQVRALAGKTQTELGDDLGVTKSNVSQWENGRHEPSYAQVMRMADMADWKMPPPGLPSIDAWPFRHVTRAQWDALDDAERARAEARVEAVVEEWASVVAKRAVSKTA